MTILTALSAIVFCQEATLRPFDRIRITATGRAGFSIERVLGSDTGVKLPNGRIAILGSSTLSEAASEVKVLAGPLIESIGIEIIGERTRAISFRGAVKRSGTLSLKSPKSISALLTIAEPTEAADINGVLVVSQLGNVFRVDSELNPNFPLRAGDQVLVPLLTDQNTILVLGAVKTPGSLPYSTGETLEKAVLRAGGMTGHAVLAEVSIVRKGITVVGADWSDAGRKTVLKRGDVIRVPALENGRYVSVIGFVKTPGLVPYRPGMTLLEAITEAGGTTVGAGRDSVEIRKVFGGTGRGKKIDINLIKMGTASDPKLQPADVVFVPEFVFKPPAGSSGFRPVVPPRRKR